MNKPLTLAQQQYLVALIERAKAAQAAVTSYIDDYLRDEHGAPAGDGWQLRDIQTGFVLVDKPMMGAQGNL